MTAGKNAEQANNGQGSLHEIVEATRYFDDTEVDEDKITKHIGTPSKTEWHCKAESNYGSDVSVLKPVVLSILATETAERFAYFGFRAILVLYFKNELLYSDSQAISLFAYTSSTAYCSPILGAILADGYYGRFRVILYFSILYFIGLVALTCSGFLSIEASSNGNKNFSNSDNGIDVDSNLLYWKRVGTFVGLAASCIGTGGIKPCVSAFGADQVEGGNCSSTIRRDQKQESQCRDEKHQDMSSPIICLDKIDNNDSEIENLHHQYPSNNHEESETHFDEGHKHNNHHRLDHHRLNTNASKDKRHLQDDDSAAKPNDEGHAVRTYFSSFYFCVNVGALTSFGCIPLIRTRYGYGFSFLLLAIAMLLAVMIFLSQRNRYIHHIPGKNESSLIITCQLCVWFLKQKISNFLRLHEQTCESLPPSSIFSYSASCANQKNSEVYLSLPSSSHFIDVDCKANSHRENEQTSSSLQHKERQMQYINDAKQVLHIMPIMIMFPIFWMLYDQQSSVWTLQATRMDLHNIAPEQLGIINPIEIMIFVPMFTKYIYPFIENRVPSYISIKPLHRMCYGMILCSVSFFVSGFLDHFIIYHENHNKAKIHVLWQLAQITLLSVAEIFMSVTGLEFVYANSPQRLKTFLMSIYCLTTAVGDVLGGVLYSTVFQHTTTTVALYSCAAIMLFNLIIFYAIVVPYWEHRQTQQRQLQFQPFRGERSHNRCASEESLRDEEGLEMRSREIT